MFNFRFIVYHQQLYQLLSYLLLLLYIIYFYHYISFIIYYYIIIVLAYSYNETPFNICDKPQKTLGYMKKYDGKKSNEKGLEIADSRAAPKNQTRRVSFGSEGETTTGSNRFEEATNTLDNQSMYEFLTKEMGLMNT